MIEYDEKTDPIIDACEAADFDDIDFVRVALACLEQAGLPARHIGRVAAIVSEVVPTAAPKSAVAAFVEECSRSCVEADDFAGLMDGPEMMPREDES